MFTNCRTLACGMRIVAVGAGHAVALVDRRVPGHGRRALVAAQAEVLAASISLIWPCGSWQVVQLKPLGPQIWCGPAIRCRSCYVAMAAIAEARGERRPGGARCRGARAVGLRRPPGLVAAMLEAVSVDGRGPCAIGGRAGLGGGRRAGGHVVMAAVAIDAGHAAMGVLRGPPLGPLRALVLLVAPQAGLGRGPPDRPS